MIKYSKKVIAGYCMERADYAPMQIYSIMRRCWEPSRPVISEIAESLREQEAYVQAHPEDFSIELEETELAYKKADFDLEAFDSCDLSDDNADSNGTDQELETLTEDAGARYVECTQQQGTLKRYKGSHDRFSFVCRENSNTNKHYQNKYRDTRRRSSMTVIQSQPEPNDFAQSLV
eukprot:m.3858 g.3858  ORF g.3858 m.3858 type:complete len:176 (+) comp4527_c0_seq1:283-810(+)